MKLWEILKEGKIGSIYKCRAGESYYSSVVAKVAETTNGFCFSIIEDENGIQHRKLVELCGLVIESEWEEINPEPVYVDFVTAYQNYNDGVCIKGRSGAIYCIEDHEEMRHEFKKDDIDDKWEVLN
jgi:hypothetical protein